MSFRYPVVMPKMSMTMETGELILYHVKPGDRVSSGDVLFEVMTDKIDMEVEAPADGVIEQLIGEIGIDIPIGTPVLIMQTDTEVMAFDFGGEAPTIPAPPEAIVEPVVLPEPVIVPEPVVVPEPVIVPEPVRAEVGVKAVPKARIVAAQKGIDLQSVVATGPDNTIMLADVTQIRPSDEIHRRQSANKALIAKGLEMTRLIPQSSFSRTVSTSVDTAALLAAWASVLRSRPELNISPKDGSELSFVGVAVIIESKYGSALPVFKDPDFLAALELSELVSTT
ncbi:MAG: biotin/lipoyl-containing protein, partial [Actinomycetes bacterium]